MNSKLLVTACIGFSLAFWAGCTQTPPTTLIVTSGSGGGGLGSGTSDGGSDSTGSITTSSSTGSGAGTPGQARQYFENTVFPELSTTCGGCHAPPTSNGAPQWLGADATSAYNVATNYPGFLAAPDNSLLVSRGSIAHTGPAMTPTQLTHVEAWLDMEVAERGLVDPGMGGDPPVTLEQALDGYGECMDYTMWQTPPTGTSLEQLALMNTDEGVPCKSCHGSINGLGGNYLSADSMMTFEKNRTYPFVLRQVTGTVDQTGNFNKLIPSKRWIEKGSESCDPNYQDCHPRYTLNQDLMDGINSFVDYTIQQYESGACGQMP